MGIIESIVGIVIASTIGAMGIGAAGINVIGATLVAGVIWGGTAISKSLAPKKSSTQNSPTYQFNSLQTQTNNQLPIPLIYGENKIAGNRLWQELREGNTRIDRIIALGQGEIEAIEDIRLNDIPIDTLSGVMVRSYKGTGAPESPSTPAVVDPIVANDEHARIQTVGSLKGLAYVALSVRASEQIRADYNFTSIVKGRKVRVYYDVDNWTYEYSNNPAWCLLDFLMCYNGCGLGLAEDGSLDDDKIKSIIDVQSFIDSAQYCDEKIPANQGADSANKVKRFTFNMIIDSKAPRHAIIEEFKLCCRGALTLKGKKLQFKIDRPSAPCKEITANDIIPGSEQFSTIANEENYDRIIVKYRSKADDWAIAEAIAEKSTFDNIPPVEHEVNIYSVTDFDQASRLAWYYLNKLLKERATGYFETDSRAFDLEIGDIILLSDNLMKFKKIPVKITQLGDMQDGRFGVHWRVFRDEVFTDTRGSNPPTTKVLSLTTDSFPAIENFIASQTFFGLSLLWDVRDSDCRFDIKTGSSWSEGTLVATNVTASPFFLPITKPGLYQFFLKVKKGILYSPEVSSTSIFLSDIINSNTILKTPLLKAIGAKTGLKIYNNCLKPKPHTIWEKNSLLSKEQMRVIYQNDCWVYPSCNADGAYITGVFDLGSLIETQIDINFDYLGLETAPFWQFRSSADNKNWTAFAPITQKIVTCRYYQLKYEHPKGFWRMRAPSLALDVADRTEHYTNIPLNAQTGATIEFATHNQSVCKTPFFKEVSAVASLTGAENGYCVVYEKTLDYIKIKALSQDGEGISGFCDVHVKGY